MVRGWGPRPVKGRGAGPPIRLGRPHPGGDPEVDATRTSGPSPLKPLTGHPGATFHPGVLDTDECQPPGKRFRWSGVAWSAAAGCATSGRGSGLRGRRDRCWAVGQRRESGHELDPETADREVTPAASVSIGPW
jgi:hypothetical protein